jgi:membrane protein YdbS with pleckstrin-like domain
MRFIKKKNLMEGEDLLYVPQLHWFYTVKNLVQSLPFFLILTILWRVADSIEGLSDWLIGGIELSLMVILAVRYVFIAGILLVLVIFVCRIFLYLSTEYGVTNKRLIIKKGIIRVVVAEIPIDRIESIYCIQGIFGRLFHYGMICVSGIGGMMPVFSMVSRPYALRRKIVDIIEKNKAITVVYGDMSRLKPQVKPKPEPEMEPEPISRYGIFVRVLPDDAGE